MKKRAFLGPTHAADAPSISPVRSAGGSPAREAAGRLVIMSSTAETTAVVIDAALRSIAEFLRRGDLTLYPACKSVLLALH